MQNRSLSPNKEDFLCVLRGLRALCVGLFTIRDCARFLIISFSPTVRIAGLLLLDLPSRKAGLV